jgi:hypothetical protein
VWTGRLETENGAHHSSNSGERRSMPMRSITRCAAPSPERWPAFPVARICPVPATEPAVSRPDAAARGGSPRGPTARGFWIRLAASDSAFEELAFPASYSSAFWILRRGESGRGEHVSPSRGDGHLARLAIGSLCVSYPTPGGLSNWLDSLRNPACKIVLAGLRESFFRCAA